MEGFEKRDFLIFQQQIFESVMMKSQHVLQNLCLSGSE